MTRLTILLAAWATLLFTGIASAEKFTNTLLFNTKWLNTKWLNTADLNAGDGGATFYNPWTGEWIPDVYLDRTAFAATFTECDAAGQECWTEQRYGDEFVGTWTTAVLGDGTPSYTYISARWTPPDSLPGMSLYQIYTWAPDETGHWHWAEPCHDSHGDVSSAIPLLGAWNHTTGARTSYGGSQFTWACTTGALGKCASSGIPNGLRYAPWQTDFYYKPNQDADGTWYLTTVDGQRTHQACTRMIRADYCGDGNAHTQDGNPIDVRDYLLRIFPQDTDPSWRAEALWNEHGAAWMSCMRDGSPMAVLTTQPALISATVLSCATNHHRIFTEGHVCDPYYLPLPEEVFPYDPVGPMQMALWPAGPGKVLLGNRTGLAQGAP